MPTLRLRFPGGRYHATPEGHHVNEGLVEWPPSPWRLLRALIASGYATLRWTEIPSAARSLVEALATSLPRYRLPPVSIAHSRHYMPVGVLGKDGEKTTLVFDTWANVGEGEVQVKWDCVLETGQARMLAQLAGNLGYLGRSESWVECEANIDDAAFEADAYPHVDGEHPGPGWNQVSVLAAERPASYREWREERVRSMMSRFPALPAGSKKPAKPVLKLREKAEEGVRSYPADLLDALQWDTSRWKAFHWGRAPGARTVLYWLRTETSRVVSARGMARPEPPSVTTMLLALCSPGRGNSVLPLMGRALPQAEMLHRALIARVASGRRVDCPELTGRSEDGRPLEGHRHAHVFPVDLDHDGHLDHFVLHAPMGLGSGAQEAVRSLRRTWMKGGVGELRVALAGQGGLEALRALSSPLSQGIVALLGPKSGARIWHSCTPLVLPRYLKAHGRNTLEGQVNAELASRALPGATVTLLPWDDATRPMRHAVRVRRPPAKGPPVDAGFAVRLEFEVPVHGPLALGYGSHFGLGMFGSVEGS